MLSLREYKEEYGLPTSMCLNVTDSCNLRCKYCFINQAPHFMTLDTAIAAVEYLMKNLKRKREITNNNSLKAILNFFGGEPMLMYDEIIVPLTKYIKEKYPKDIELGITTNGTLLNKERIDFLYDNKILPLLSIDGDRETQEYNRPCASGESSFDLVEKNIPYLLKKFSNTTFRMTIYEDTCDKLFDNILYAERMGFKRFYCIPDSRHNFSKDNLKKLEKELELSFLYFFLSLSQGITPITSELFEEPLLETLTLELRKQDENFNFLNLALARDIIRCGLGTSSISVNYEGNIYGCQEQASKSNLFFIGDIFNGISKEKHLKLLTLYRTIRTIECEDKQQCQNCIGRLVCQEIQCPSMAQERFNNFLIQSKTQCWWKQTLIKFSQQILKNKNDYIYNYIDNLIKQRGESYG